RTHGISCKSAGVWNSFYSKKSLFSDDSNNARTTTNWFVTYCGHVFGLHWAPDHSRIPDWGRRSHDDEQCDRRAILERARGRTDCGRDCARKTGSWLRHLAELLALVVQRAAPQKESAV